MYKSLSDIAKQLQRIADALELIAKNNNKVSFTDPCKLYERKEPRTHY